jgi:hypothetical protein
LASKADGDTTISSNVTQNGGTFSISPPTLLISHATNNPLLTLTGDVVFANVNSVVVGNRSSEEGRLLVNGGGVKTNTGYQVVSFGTNTETKKGWDQLT